jgi:hypothetical protein
MEQGPPRTPRFFRRFEVWFGRLFLGIGGAALLAAAILYLVLRDDPGLGSRIWAFLLSPLTIGVIFSAIGASYLRRGLKRARTEAQLLQHGTTTEATVTTIEVTGTRVNRHSLWRVRYAYEDLHGTSHEGEDGHLSADEAQSYRIGERALIRYDPASPETSIWLGREDPAQPL